MADDHSTDSLFKIIMGCGCGCLLFIILLLGVGGYLVYLEEGQDYMDPGEEVERFEITPGQPFEISFTWDGTNYASNRIYLDMEGKKANGKFLGQGKIGCSRGGDPYMVDVNLELSEYMMINYKDKGPDEFSAWLYTHEEYATASSTPFKCVGTITATTGEITKANLVITRKQRPSDYFAF